MNSFSNLHEELKHALEKICPKRAELLFAGFITDERVIAKIIEPIAHKVSRIDIVFSPQLNKSPGFLNYFFKSKLNLTKSEFPKVFSRVIAVKPHKRKNYKLGIFHSKYLMVFERPNPESKRVLKALYLGSMNWSGYHFSDKRNPVVLESFVSVDLNKLNGIEKVLGLSEFRDRASGSCVVETSAKIIQFIDDGKQIKVEINDRLLKQFSPNDIAMIAAPYITQKGVECLLKGWEPPMSEADQKKHNPRFFGPSGSSKFRLHGKFVIGVNDKFIMVGSANITDAALNGINHETSYLINNPGDLKALREDLSRLNQWHGLDSTDCESEDEPQGDIVLPDSLTGMIISAILKRHHEDLCLEVEYFGKKLKSRYLTLIAGKNPEPLKYSLAKTQFELKKNKVIFKLPINDNKKFESLKPILQRALSTQKLYLQMDVLNYQIPVDLGEFWSAELAVQAQKVFQEESKKKKKGESEDDESEINWNGKDIRPLRVLESKISDSFRWLWRKIKDKGYGDDPLWLKFWRKDPWCGGSSEQ